MHRAIGILLCDFAQKQDNTRWQVNRAASIVLGRGVHLGLRGQQRRLAHRALWHSNRAAIPMTDLRHAANLGRPS